jgi:hypothetical protein
MLESAFSHRNWQGDPITIFLWTDGVLLKLCNQKEKCYTWSIVAMANRIITLTVSPFQDLTDIGITMFIPNHVLRLDIACICSIPIEYTP